ncbi:4-(cytidine 5'-diphospho)-2-C-methyl-D-erythritol kinase [Segnochrobactrum spirostomi]|uniref:4-diphosphocytidyl-2-C-methyl-D-erythritol kinase n=1 Tax=Segnochrobactrum spirostomi TaxID=2608987 RepID=A0A6A7Y4D7_9HYPH|nr:4-(cytidine 5'-diphospho)-2-C-methyl-D-erythritol kinase [Segnochrobactrum spirostomi]MQT14000.1 4-(cytidine 5'-diphospho)-2-C-methyl-D-erythritol kinase [Segnochrobactrum spirostomi]
MFAEVARAKVNLALHITGRRADGYHDVDTLVAFPEVGDRLVVEPAGEISLEVDGPFAAAVPTDGANLVLRAARLLAEAVGVPARGARFRLTKALPVASGIGGGSADAAAALRLLNRLWGLDLALEALAALSRPLGADLPICVLSTPARATGIGHDIAPLPALPNIAFLLVNPGVPVATPDVFRALERRDNAPLPAGAAAWRDARDLAEWLAATRNDLEPAAQRVAPVIGEVVADLAATSGALLARLSGSGATAFALFATADEAAAAATRLARTRPSWWIKAADGGATNAAMVA